MIHTNLLELCCIGGALLITSNLWFLLRVLRPIQKLSLQAENLKLWRIRLI